MLRIDASSYDRFAKTVGLVASEIRPTDLPYLLRRGADELLAILRNLAPRRSGALRAGLFYRAFKAHANPYVEFWSQLPDGRQKPWWQARTVYWQTKGTRTPIRPTKAHFLKVPRRDGQGFIDLKQVRGQKVQPFDREAALQGASKLDRILRLAGAVIISKLAGNR